VRPIDICASAHSGICPIFRGALGRSAAAEHLLPFLLQFPNSLIKNNNNMQMATSQSTGSAVAHAGVAFAGTLVALRCHPASNYAATRPLAEMHWCNLF
jgi:hypothetical protein